MTGSLRVRGTCSRRVRVTVYVPFYGVVCLLALLYDVKTEEVFVVSRIREDAVSRMLFLVAH